MCSNRDLDLDLVPAMVILVRISGRGLPAYQIISKSEKKTFGRRTDGRTPEFQSIRSTPGDGLILDKNYVGESDEHVFCYHHYNTVVTLCSLRSVSSKKAPREG